ncbi:MAG: aldo/keto reductase [Gemmatimonadetes bacterium]|nr:aldo/keto reductase [Gemmatimonadota bacterium]
MASRWLGDAGAPCDATQRAGVAVFTVLPHVTLNNGVELPILGLGVFQSPPAETAAAVEAALRSGYRLIDTAAAYANEREVGEGIRRAGVARDEVFVETKVWISDYGYDQTLHAFDKSARASWASSSSISSCLHQPLLGVRPTLAAYRALETLLVDGRVRAIGVSNFMPEHLERLLAVAKVVPAVNQIEVHPYFQQAALQRPHAAHGVATQAWSPIGGITSYRGMEKRSFDDPTLLAIARQHGKSAAQVMLRWHVQQGRSAIPKSVQPARIAENFDVFDFTLTTEQMAAIDALETGVRGGPEPDVITLDAFGIPIPEA